MPKFPKSFGRRRSTATTFEDVSDGPVVEHSFKVFERPVDGSKSFDGGIKVAKPHPGVPKTSTRVEDNMFENLIIKNRGSGASNTNTASTTDNSSRLSAASTTPSSTDVSGRDEWRSPHDKPFSDIPVPPMPKSASAFSLKSAGRSLSWGRNNSKTPTSPSSKELPATPVEKELAQGRTRAVTASSYASTATPPKLEETDLSLNLGGDFGDLFAGFDKRKSAILLESENGAKPQSSEATRSYSSNHYNKPSLLNIDTSKEVEPSPYSWSSQHSQDRLMSNSSPPPAVPPRNAKQAPPVPQHGSSRTSDGSQAFSRPQRPGGVADTALRRSSAVSARRQSTLEYDEDARILRESVNANRRLNEPSSSPKVRDSWALPSDSSYKVGKSTLSSWNVVSVETTTRPKKQESKQNEEGLFDARIEPSANTTTTRVKKPESRPPEDRLDTHFAASANLAQLFQERPPSPPQNKVMTPAQFERYRQDKERLQSIDGKPREEEEEEEAYDDDEDEAEKNRQLAKLRRKQEAHMSVYRQQMMKVTGEAPPAGLPRPGVFASQSSPNLGILGNAQEGEEEDEEVPLAILQAHGFPNKNKPPMRSMGSIPNLRGQSMGGGEGRLPVFARNLPEDPYFGAGIVHPSNRESMAFGGGAGSVHGAPSRGLPPGGLVGVIATEERSRAMRRGSPKPASEYGPVPPPANGFNGMGVPPNGSFMNGMGPMGPMGPMMLTPGDQAQIHMSQQMQQFMQMQMQFMQMMTTGQGPPQQNGHVSQPSLGGISGAGNQPPRPGSSHQRVMTMMEPNAAPWMQRASFAPSIRAQGVGYAPSIAPSERSNIGLPGRYRPVSQAQPMDNKSRTSTMSGGLQGWENKNVSSTLKVVKKSENLSDEEDEEDGWEQMAKKREQKKSMWRSKKDHNGLKDFLTYSH